MDKITTEDGVRLLQAICHVFPDLLPHLDPDFQVKEEPASDEEIRAARQAMAHREVLNAAGAELAHTPGEVVELRALVAVAMEKFDQAIFSEEEMIVLRLEHLEKRNTKEEDEFHERFVEMHGDMAKRLETLEEDVPSTREYRQDERLTTLEAADGRRVVQVDEHTDRMDRLGRTIMDLRGRIPAGDGIRALAGDVDHLRIEHAGTAELAKLTDGGLSKLERQVEEGLSSYALDERLRLQEQIDDWGVIFGELANRLSALEQAALRVFNARWVPDDANLRARLDGLEKIETFDRLRARVDDLENRMEEVSPTVS